MNKDIDAASLMGKQTERLSPDKTADSQIFILWEVMYGHRRCHDMHPDIYK